MRTRTQILRARDFYNRPDLVKKASRLVSQGGELKSLLNDQAPGTIILNWEGDTLLGWAYLNRAEGDSSYRTNVYVRASRRNEGIGKRILSTARKFASKNKRGLYGFPHDEVGTHLFDEMGIRHETQNLRMAQ